MDANLALGPAGGAHRAPSRNVRHNSENEAASLAAGDSMSFREVQREQREKTSQALIEAALDLAAAEGYASLSLRSVARKAGIAPTSFYRHFREMDELGLAIMEQAAERLSEWMDRFRQARRSQGAAAPKERSGRPSAIGALIQPFVESFLKCLSDNDLLLRIFFQERTGSIPALRKAVNRATDALVASLSEEVQRFGKETGAFAGPVCRLAAETLMMAAVTCGMDMLTRSGQSRDDALDRAVRMSELVLLGAWEKGG